MEEEWEGKKLEEKYRKQKNLEINDNIFNLYLQKMIDYKNSKFGKINK